MTLEQIEEINMNILEELMPKFDASLAMNPYEKLFLIIMQDCIERRLMTLEHEKYL